MYQDTAGDEEEDNEHNARAKEYPEQKTEADIDGELLHHGSGLLRLGALSPKMGMSFILSSSPQARRSVLEIPVTSASEQIYRSVLKNSTCRIGR